MLYNKVTIHWHFGWIGEKHTSQGNNLLQRPEHYTGWKLQKFHDITHMPSDIYKYGSSSNYDTGQGERGLKAWGKYPAKTVQMWGSKIL